MIEIIIGLVAALVAALGWGKWERDGKKDAQRERDALDRQRELSHDIEEGRREIDQRMRESEGDNEARDHRTVHPNDY